jgi:Bacterial aa3 type cytochrome c oxidase subunit IV
MASGNDMQSANQTFSNFTSLVKWGSILTAIVAIFVVLLIA